MVALFFILAIVLIIVLLMPKEHRKAGERGLQIEDRLQLLELTTSRLDALTEKHNSDIDRLAGVTSQLVTAKEEEGRECAPDGLKSKLRIAQVPRRTLLKVSHSESRDLPGGIRVSPLPIAAEPEALQPIAARVGRETHGRQESGKEDTQSMVSVGKTIPEDSFTNRTISIEASREPIGSGLPGETHESLETHVQSAVRSTHAEITSDEEPNGYLDEESNSNSNAEVGITLSGNPAAIDGARGPKRYTEKASRMEMEFAGTYLNIIGIIFLLAGIVIYFSLALSNVANGVSQSLCGVSLGLLLVFTGHYLYHKNMQKFAHPLIGGGFCILFFTICAAYFHYGLIGKWILFTSIFTIIAWSGISIFRYDSKLIGNGMLIAAFLAPFFMKFSFNGVGTISFYLIAINMGVAYVAYYKKWDYYLTVAFIATYILYFYHFHMTQPLHALFFLIAIYLLFLVSNNILHFVRKSSSDYHIFLSYVSPTIFAITSYFVLIKMANIWATLVYVLLAAIHIGLAWKAHAMEEKDPKFSEIVKNNLVLGILFLTASISFITYFSKLTVYFSTVTAMWFIEALFLLKLSFKWGGSYETILRRYSYFALILASAQLLFVIPVMEAGSSVLFKSIAIAGFVRVVEAKILIYLASFGAYFYYFLTLYEKRSKLGGEEKAAMSATLYCSLAVITSIANKFAPGIIGIEISFALLSLIALHMSLKYFSEYSRVFRLFSYLLLFLQAIRLTDSISDANIYSLLALITATGIYACYFLLHQRLITGANLEDQIARIGSLLAAFTSAAYLLSQYIPLVPARLMLCGGLSYLTLYASFKIYREYDRLFRAYSFVLLIMTTIQIFSLVDLSPEHFFLSKSFFTLLLSVGGYYGYFLILYGNRHSLSVGEKYFMVLNVTATLSIACYLVFMSAHGALYYQVAGEVCCLLILIVSLRYFDVLKGCQNFGFIGLVLIVISILFSGGFTQGGALPLFLNGRFLTHLFIAGLCLLYSRILKKSEHLLPRDEKWTVPATFFMTALILVKTFLLETTGSGSTLLWALTALGILSYSLKQSQRESYITLSQVIFFIAFLKSVIFDANFSFENGCLGIAPLGALHFSEVIAIMAIIAVYTAAAKLVWGNYEQRNFLVALALFIFFFQSSFILYELYGKLDFFQVILSAFWSVVAFSFITYGIFRELKIFRQFGLILLVSSILKILLVDLWVLGTYDKVTTFIIIGVLLMITSFLYQKQRNIIAEKYQAKKLALDGI